MSGNDTRFVSGEGGELHQLASGDHVRMTTAQGVVIGDDQNSLKAGPRGPVLLEDFVLREKIFHFDHERIPERVVHARGFGVHGHFELTKSLERHTRARVLAKTGERVPVFVRFSTVVGNKGSMDLARDVRGFAVKFYTEEGNWDLVGNNIPVFFIQDAMKFPDVVHAAKQEPDRGFPQAQSAHDTFWDFISLTPESMHMIMWIMSDRTIPRSFRMMEGFGVHSFRLVNAAGESTFVKFHWRPRLQSQSVLWDEALKINGADPDFHRRDLWQAIETGNFPEWDLAVQLFTEAEAERFDFDHLDSTKIIPEEVVPLQVIGKLTLDRTVDNFFAETEQVAFCTQNVVPGIDFSDDPLLQGRNFSYLDTQLKRLGSPNFTQLPINAPRCPFANFQRDGHMQMHVPNGRVAYQPSLLDPSGPREDPRAGFTSHPATIAGPKARHRSATFADHYSQARQFFLSQTEAEQAHIVAALVFELGKVDTLPIRGMMIAHLHNILPQLGERVATGLNFQGEVPELGQAVPTRTDLRPSPSLSLLAKFTPTLKGRKLGILVTDGADGEVVAKLEAAMTAAGGLTEIIAPRIGGVTLISGRTLAADHDLQGGPSVLFDAVAVVASADGTTMLQHDQRAVAWVHDAFQHLKVIGHSAAALPLLNQAGVMPDDGIVNLDRAGVSAFGAAAARGRIWPREPLVRTMF